MSRRLPFGYSGFRLPGDAGATPAQTAAIQKARARAQKNARGETTNDVFAHENAEFIAACELAEVKPTARQASKYRRRVGLAWQARERTTSEARQAALAANG